MELYERLKMAISSCSNGNQSAFVRDIGESVSTFNGYLSAAGQNRIKFKTLRQILVRFNLDANWLMLGVGGMFRGGEEPEPKAADPIAQRVDQVVSTMREAGVDDLKILAAARDMLEGEITKLTRARGGYTCAEPRAGMPKAAEDPGVYEGSQKAAGDGSV